ncbi:hypothetical protein DPMN_135127 [Dreissena polymorpha]|uniref:Uncharacterized protein n=1 Tax=Dreissena polymorpha TaxID=45954 RepID=A0A9D4FXG3_DREPO|nr:hypothetical protein DPMN_135127 [Dreissena polymorpha]
MFPPRYTNINEQTRDFLWEASDEKRIHENNVVLPKMPEANLAFARKCSDIVAGNSRGICCATKNEHFVSR